jgi:hypothetical protein
VSIFLGFGNGFFADKATYPTDSHPYSVAVGDFNKDTRLDLAVVNADSASVSILLGFGNGSFAYQIRYRAGSRPVAIAVGDFNNDTRLDLVIANNLGDTMSVLLGRSNEVFRFQVSLTTGSDSRPRSLFIGDLNGDDRMDIAVVYSNTHSIGIFFGNSNITFAPPVTYSTGPNTSPYSIAVGDFNNDKQPDIVVANYRANNLGIFLGRDIGTFASQATYSTGFASGPYAVAVDDMNKDGALDIVVANYEANDLGIFVGNGDGTFVWHMSLALQYGSRSFFVGLGDFNNDEKLNLAIANKGTDSLSIFLLTCY